MEKVRFSSEVDGVEVVVSAVVYDDGEIDDVLVTDEDGNEYEVTEEIEDKLMGMVDNAIDEDTDVEIYGSQFE